MKLQYFYIKKTHKVCISEIEKESQCVQKASAIIESVKEEINKSLIIIKIEYSNDRPKVNRTFQQEPHPILVKECDKKSKEIRG